MTASMDKNEVEGDGPQEDEGGGDTGNQKEETL
jgi:hypothetical protein